MIHSTSIFDKARNFIWGPRPVTLSSTLRVKHRCEEPPSNAADMLVIDVSESMQSVDYKPTRLGGASEAARRFLEKRAITDAGATAGIVVFGSTARVVAPLRPIHSHLETLRAALLDLACQGSTNTGAGLEKAAEALRSISQGTQRRVILLTDGHANMGRDAELVASEIKGDRIQLDIIGIGGSPDEVNEPVLKKMASIVQRQRRYWFIRSAGELVEKFETLALREIK